MQIKGVKGGNVETTDEQYLTGLVHGVATQGITNIGGNKGNVYTIGKGGIYLTTKGDLTISNGIKTEYYADLSGNESLSVGIEKAKNLFTSVGFTNVYESGGYIFGTVFNGYEVKFGPLSAGSTGKLNTSATWYMHFLMFGIQVYKNSGTVSSQGGNVWRLTINKILLDIASYTQEAIEIPRNGLTLYRLGNTNYFYYNGTIYLDGVSMAGRVTSTTPGYSDAFNSYYLKLFCNPIEYTDFERQITGCYPVCVDGVADSSLILARFRASVSSNAWIVVREVTQRVGYLMCTHIMFGSDTAAFMILDCGEQYADYVDSYLANKVISTDSTSYGFMADYEA